MTTFGKENENKRQTTSDDTHVMLNFVIRENKLVEMKVACKIDGSGLLVEKRFRRSLTKMPRLACTMRRHNPLVLLKCTVERDFQRTNA